jgi:predicted amidophosphoribosyltransferase
VCRKGRWVVMLGGCRAPSSTTTHQPPTDTRAQKTKHTGSQTNKNRFLRWDNVSENFLVGNLSPPKYQHYAIIDDVITTGSTIEAMINALKQNYPELRFSILSLAVTK